MLLEVSVWIHTEITLYVAVVGITEYVLLNEGKLITGEIWDCLTEGHRGKHQVTEEQPPATRWWYSSRLQSEVI